VPVLQNPLRGVECSPVDCDRCLVAIVVSALCAAAAPPARLVARQPRQAPVFHGGVDLVNVGVTVTNKKGNLISDLKADDFEIREDGRLQTIRYFSMGDGETSGPSPELHLGVLLDVSASMADDIGFTRTAAIRFLNSLLDAVDITLVDFDTEVRVARYGQRDFARLVERIRQQKLGVYTAMYDAIGVYLDGADGQEGRKIMVLYTDGGDTRSSLRFSEVVDLLKASDVTVYAIGALDHQPGAVRNAQRLILQQIADTTGGQAYFPTSVMEVDKIYEHVVAEIRAQYAIGYVSTNETTDGAWRKVDIKVTRPDAKDLKIRSRRGYFAPYRNRTRPSPAGR
jgi:Ca-activated chloride channel family protein